jgi:hypothetical protein
MCNLDKQKTNARPETVSGNAPMTDGQKHFGKTKGFFNQILGTILRRHISADNKQFLVFSLPTHFLRRDNGAVWLSHIATNLFTAQATILPKQTNPLQSPPLFSGFSKATFGYP